MRRGPAPLLAQAVRRSFARVRASSSTGWSVVLPSKSTRMGWCEDSVAIGGAQLPRAQHSAGVGVAPVQRGGDERGEPGDQRPDLLRCFRKGGGPALLQQCYGDAALALRTSAGRTP